MPKLLKEYFPCIVHSAVYCVHTDRLDGISAEHFQRDKNSEHRTENRPVITNRSIYLGL